MKKHTVLNNFIDKLFYQQIFTIAIRKNMGLCIHSQAFTDEPFTSVLTADLKNWYADPFIIKHEGKSYIFFENFYRGKGKLQVGTIHEDLTIGDIRDVLDEKIHLSYPFVFCISQQWYLIPESHQAKEIRVYKALEFPYVWVLDRVLLSGIDALDSTLFKYNGSNYLITAIRQKRDEAVHPRVFKLTNDLPADWILHELSWKNHDMYNVRPAGKIFEINDRSYRPSQMCAKHEYGKSVIINEMDVLSLQNGEYFEKEVIRLGPENVSISNLTHKVTGLHTYNRSTDYEVIDAKFMQRNLLKIFRAFRRKVGKH